ncbi:MAG: hypothetical protein HeimAB125_03190 [Candidatus Heimdallarchaeota archaeon AB_125]|nr:MAG: hypothetical protein HeimAB125_03190 [Candidatus Heimdallarchaeota archaeon AB_125]
MINVIIATKNFRFVYKLNEILDAINEVKTEHILPDETVPEDTDVVITTETEKLAIKWDKKFIPKAFNRYYLYSNILYLSTGIDNFSEVIIGIDPGKTIGYAVVADKKTIVNTLEIYTAVDTVKEVISTFFNIETDSLVIKIGAGGGSIKEEIVHRLNDIFYEKVPIHIVKEDFTSKTRLSSSEKRFSKNITSALLITSRETYV